MDVDEGTTGEEVSGEVAADVRTGVGDAVRVAPGSPEQPASQVAMANAAAIRRPLTRERYDEEVEAG